jgi:hypothetical protein
VSSDYFRVLSIPLVAGRTFTADENRSEVVVSESVARLFPEGRALGQQLVTTASSATGEPAGRVHQIVGIVKDLPVRSLDNIEPVVYWRPDLGATLLVRTASPATLPRVNAILTGGLPGSPTWGSQTLREHMLVALSSLVFGSYVAWAIGVIALSLATIGAFGVFAYVVEQRRREIAVRLALGAPSTKVIVLVLGAISRPVLIGLAVGLALSSVAAPLLRNALYGLSPFDPVTYLRIAAILTLAAGAATLIPAWRATRIDPATVLRTE